MKKISEFIVKRRIILLVITLVITAVCGFLATKSQINTDMTKYLADSSGMKQGMDIMERDFPQASDEASIRVMFDNLNKEQITNVKSKLEAIPHIATVSYEADNADYNKDNHTLFVVSCDYDYDSKEELSIEQALQNDFTDYEMIYCNNDTPTTPVPFALLASALGILIVILLIMSKSWLEPVLFLATIGIAVVINLGTNIIFPYTAELTSSIAPILQLALSMDYSIILMNRYRQEKLTHDNKLDAMKEALGHSITSISSSSLTTVVGLLALVFLTFKLGPELGIILAKGVFISMLCVFIILPTLVLACDKGIEKTSKKAHHIPTDFLAKFNLKARFVLPVIFVVLLVGSAVIQNNTAITFTQGITDDIAKVFPKENQVIVLYDNDDKKSIEKVIEFAEKDQHVKSAVSYTNTIGKMNNTSEMTGAILGMGEGAQIDESLVKMLFYLYNNGEMPKITAEEFIAFIKTDVANNPVFSKYMGDKLVGNMDLLDKFSSREKLTKKMTSDEIADFFGMKSEDIQKLFYFYFSGNTDTAKWKLSPQEFVDFTVQKVLPDKNFAGYFDEATSQQLAAGKVIIDAVVSQKEYSENEMYKLLSTFTDELTQSNTGLLYIYYAGLNNSDENWKMTIPQMLDFVSDKMINNDAYAGFFDEKTKADIIKSKWELEAATEQLKGKNYSRLILTTDYQEESSATSDFMQGLDNICKESLEKDYHLIGSSAMVFEMENSFKGEYLTITIITAIAIFMVILLAFGNFAIPLILTLLVQCGVFITVSFIGLQGNTIYYLALLIVQSILMGATIDYAIVFTSYYRESRITCNRLDSLKTVYNNSIHTIMTSGSIIILVTGILGMFSADKVTSQVCTTISLGALVAVLLILLVLPALLAFADRIIVKKPKQNKTE